MIDDAEAKRRLKEFQDQPGYPIFEDEEAFFEECERWLPPLYILIGGGSDYEQSGGVGEGPF